MDETTFIFLTTAGTLVTVIGLLNLYKTFSRRIWPDTVGKILKNETKLVDQTPNTLISGDLISKQTLRPAGRPKRKAELRLSYVYAIDGEKFIGDKLYSAPLMQFSPNRIFDLYEGDIVKVFYKPDCPAKAFLAHSYGWPSSLTSIAGGLTVLCSVYLRYLA